MKKDVQMSYSRIIYPEQTSNAGPGHQLALFVGR